MPWKDVVVWLFARKTRAGSQYLYGAEREARIRLLGEAATRAYEDSRAQQNRDFQHSDDDVIVKVKNGFDQRHRRYVTDVLVIPRDGSGDRYHLIIDADGNELYSNFHQG